MRGSIITVQVDVECRKPTQEFLTGRAGQNRGQQSRGTELGAEAGGEKTRKIEEGAGVGEEVEMRRGRGVEGVS